MDTILTQQLNSRVAWTPAEISRSREWLYAIPAPALDEIDAALAALRARGVDYRDMVLSDFPVPSLARDLPAILHEVDHGRGFVQMKGVRVAAFCPGDAERMFWGIGLHIGAAVSQNPRGERLANVRDEGLNINSGVVRGYQTRAAQGFHTDIGGDVVGLMCINPAKSGGRSRVTSSMAVHNAMLSRYPRLLDLLYKHWDVDWRGEQLPGTPPVYREPVYAFTEGRLTCRFAPRFLRSAPEKTGIPLSDVELEAISTMERLADELTFEIDFDPGDVQLINNYAILHGRTGYEDFPEPDRRRSLLRLWLNRPEPGPLLPAFANGPARKGVPVHA
ncbi:MAG: TauD/TfdA family dioxygenase [Proteobacteria bacterium]|nr:TauD/TfdA family dioxygenase [Pseudomonadota bacterium]